MKYGVIDIGSNSVRLMLNEKNKTLYKLVTTTRLAEGMGSEKILKAQSVDRTVSAVSFFVDKAKKEKVDKLYIFATAAVRNAVNSGEFVKVVKQSTGFDVDVISGETEAYIGRIGAIGNADGGIIDVGGASSEVTAVIGGNEVFSKSLDLGVVKIKDHCEQDRFKAQRLIENKIREYGLIPKTIYHGIGGTATTIAAMLMELEPYDPDKVDGFYVSLEELEKLTDKLYQTSVEDRKGLKGLQPARAEVIAGGVLLMQNIIKKIGLDGFFVSERDNLEGYLELKRSKDEKEN